MPWAKAARIRAFFAKIFAILAFLMPLALVGLLASAPIRNSDVWLHLAAGKELYHGDIQFGTDPFALTTEGVHWVNTSWLFDLACYEAFSWGDGLGLSLLKVLLAMGAGLFLVRLTGSDAAGLLIVTLSLVASGPWVYLQPELASFFFLALTLWLMRGPIAVRREGADAVGHGFPAYLPVLLVQIIWVNSDAWFFLGPVAACLIWLGGRLRPAHAGEAPRLPFWPVPALAAVCLVNPYHFEIFATVPETVVPWFSQDLHDPLFAELTASPFSAVFLHSANGQSAGGMAYYTLAALGALVLLLNRQARRWDHALLWLAFLGLSAVQAKAIPFFAAVAGPVTAWGLRQFAAQRGRVVSPRLAHVRKAIVMLGVTVLCLAAWPGWLQPAPYEPRRWEIHPDPSVVQAARQLAHWYDAGRLPPASRGFCYSPAMAHYLAWFCPEEKGFVDERLPIFHRATGDFVTLRQALLAPAEDNDRQEELRTVLRKWRMNHVIVYEKNAARRAAIVFQLIQKEHEWPLLYMAGGIAVFGWNDPKNVKPPNSFAALRLDTEQLAFAPEIARHAPAKWSGEPAHRATLWELFTQNLTPSPDRDEAMLFLLLFDAFAGKTYLADNNLWRQTLVADLAGGARFLNPLAGAADMACRFMRARGSLSFEGAAKSPSAAARLARDHWERFRAARDDSPVSLLLLAIRAARRALYAQPNDAAAWLILGEAYFRLGSQTRERVWDARLPDPTRPELYRLRIFQAIGAYQQALLLQPDLTRAHERLMVMYRDRGFRDLTLGHLVKFWKGTLASGPAPGETQDTFAARLEVLEKTVHLLNDQVKESLKFYNSEAGHMKVVERVDVAIRLGLAGKALEVLRKTDYGAFGAVGLRNELELFLSTGRLEEGSSWMAPEHEEVLGPFQYHWFKVQFAAALGDYALADHELEQLIPRGTPGQVHRGLSAIVSQAIADAGQQVDWPGFLFRLHQIYLPQTYFFTGYIIQAADVNVIRGLLALEVGEVEDARARFREALDLWPAREAARTGLDFQGRRLAEHWLTVLERYR
jgi:tetratricopeptide (TPR) repeat protein